MAHNLRTILSAVSGATFVGIDTEIDVTLRKTISGRGSPPNPHWGRVTKRNIGSSVMCFQNKAINGYEAMVERRLIAEGKNPSRFQLQPRKWGDRIPDLPVVRHIPKNEINPRFYLEVIFLKAGTSEYFLDRLPITKDKIIGLPPESEPAETAQGGLEDQVIIRTYAVDSLTAIRLDSTEYKAPFFFL